MNVNLLHEYVALIIEKIRTKKGSKSIMGDKFNLRYFKTIDAVQLMLAYAKKFLQQLGKPGSSRTAFLLSSKYVLKIAHNEKGIGQNESERDTSAASNDSPLITRVYAADDQNRWLIVDLVKELNEYEDFENLTGTNWDNFTATIYDHLGRRATKTLDPDKFTQQVITLCQKHDLLPGDIDKIEHWGKTPDGRVVLLDYGLTNKVWDTYYDSKRQQHKTAASNNQTVVPGKTSGTKNTWGWNKGGHSSVDHNKNDPTEQDDESSKTFNNTKQVTYMHSGMQPEPMGEPSIGDLNKINAPKKKPVKKPLKKRRKQDVATLPVPYAPKIRR